MLRKFETSLDAVHSGADYAILTGKSPIYPYENGKRASDTPIGVKLDLALHNMRLAPLSVKFERDPLPKVDDELIAAACFECRFMFVQVPDCIVTLYGADSGIGMTARAETAQIVNLNSSSSK